MTLVDLVYGPICQDLAAEDRKILLEDVLAAESNELSFQIARAEEAERDAQDAGVRVDATTKALKSLIAAAEAVTALPRLGQLCVADAAFEKAIAALKREIVDATDAIGAGS